MKKMPKSLIAFTTSLFVATSLGLALPANAKKISNLKVGNWVGGAYTNNSTGKFSHCVARANYKSGLMLLFSIGANKAWTFGFADKKWQLQKGQRNQIRWRVDNNPSTSASAIVKTKTMAQVFLPKNVETLNQFKSGKLLVIDAGAQKMNFNLTDFTPMIDRLFQCVDKNRNVAATNPFNNDTAQPPATSPFTSPGTNNPAPGLNRPSATKGKGGTGKDSVIGNVRPQTNTNSNTNDPFKNDTKRRDNPFNNDRRLPPADNPFSTDAKRAPAPSNPFAATTPKAPATPSAPAIPRAPSVDTPNAPTTTARVTNGPLNTPPTAASRAEANQRATALLTKAGINYKITPKSATSAMFQRNDASWNMGRLIGTLRIFENQTIASERVLARLQGYESGQCKGRFAKEAASEDTSNALDFMAACDVVGSSRKGLSVYYSIFPRKSGGHYVMSIFGYAKDYDNVRKLGVRLKNIATELNSRET